MGECVPKFGRVMVLVVMDSQSIKKGNYAVAQRSLDCYLSSTNYTFKRVTFNENERVKKLCMKYKKVHFQKHCIASAYLPDTDWMLVLDADTGVVNPNHCIEQWIDDRVDLVFYERFFNWEIASGNYLVKNTPFARKFLLDFADWEFNAIKWPLDNGPLQLLILKTVLPDAKIEIKACTNYWNKSLGYAPLMAYTTCVRAALGAQRIWPQKLRILRRAHGFCRDGWLTDDAFADIDFMFHGWKALNLGGPWKSPFEKMPNVSECRAGDFSGWTWRKEKQISVEEVGKRLSEREKKCAKDFPQAARIHAHLSEPDVAECYPNCDEHI
uniref:Uncharacterized protein n=1 Tax=Globodera rostochiensis TaxID=31243 RepID=A0A914H296_GLORO